MNHTKASLIPPGQQLVAEGKWPVIGERKPTDSSAPWTLRISGETENEIKLSLDQLQELPQIETVIDIHCVTRWSKLGTRISGVLLKDLLELAAPKSNAKFASFISRSDRNHSSSLGLTTALDLQTMIALEVDGAPLEHGHGGPIRNIVPGRYFYKSVKWLEHIEIMETDRLGFWEAESGYHNEADPWKEQRYMAPTLDRRDSIRLIETRDFSHRDLRSIDVSDRDLSGLAAQHASLRDANFSRAELSNANFESANLSNAHFVNANLTNANFTNADLEGADLSGANLEGANLTGCSLIGASFFSDANGEKVEAKFSESTLLPDSAIAPLFPEQLSFVRSKLNKTS